MLHIFNYLNIKRKSIPDKFGYDNCEQLHYIFSIKGESMENNYWMDFYPDAEERLPNCITDQLGRKVRISMYVDANHAVIITNRRSHSCIIICVNNAPIIL